MKITKMGQDPKTKIHHAKCSNCKTEYDFTENDEGVKYYSDQRDGASLSFNCQVCSYQVYYYIPTYHGYHD